MDYQLALELKNAGFQFNPNIDWSKRDFFWLPCFEITKDDREKLWIPTLEELIEACGEEFGIMCRIQAPISMGDSTTKPSVTKFSDGSLFVGDTYIEAVARLWLALNKK